MKRKNEKYELSINKATRQQTNGTTCNTALSSVRRINENGSKRMYNDKFKLAKEVLFAPTP